MCHLELKVNLIQAGNDDLRNQVITDCLPYVKGVLHRMLHSAGYNGGDFGGCLTPGMQYYFAITYVFADGDKSLYVSTNVLPLTYNGPAATE